jgi:hypothetical protein
MHLGLVDGNKSMVFQRSSWAIFVLQTSQHLSGKMNQSSKRESP